MPSAFWFSILSMVAVLRSTIIRDSTVWGFKMWLLAALMSDRVNKGFPVDKKMSVRLAELLKSGHNNEVAVRQGSAVHPIIYYDFKFSHVVVA